MNVTILLKLVRIKIWCICKSQLRNEVLYTPRFLMV